MLAELYKRIGRTLKPVIRYDSWRVIERDLTLSVPLIEPRLAIEFRVATQEDLVQFLDEDGQPMSQEAKEKALYRMSLGHICSIGIHKDQIVSYNWYGRNEAGLVDGTQIKLGPGWCYSYGTYVIRPFRRKGINSAHVDYDRSYRGELGIKKEISCVHTRNVASLNSYRRFSEKRIAQIRRVRFLNRWSIFWKPRFLKSYLSTVATGTTLAEGYTVHSRRHRDSP